MKENVSRKRSSVESQPRSAVPTGGISRRTFLKSLGTTAVSSAALGAESVARELAQANAEQVRGPGAVPVTLTLNGTTRTFDVEPRVTLLELIRGPAGLTGPKEACDRASCGACTVLVGDTPVYACSMLAIEAQGAAITTVEGLAPDGRLTKIQQALVAQDGLQCGYCTPGVVMALTALLRKKPNPTEAEARKAVSGNLCRCGSYPRIFAAALSASGAKTTSKLHVLHLHHHALA